MKIIIIGAGNVGYSLAENLSGAGHDIVVVESREEYARHLEDELDVKVVVGNGAKLSVLAEAGVVEGSHIDYLIACSDKDEVNIMACWQAKQSGVERVISRATSLEYTESPEWFKTLGLDLVLSPERTIARDIEEMIWVNSAIHTTEFFDGEAGSYAFRVTEDSEILGKSLKQVAGENDRLDAVFVYVKRDREGFTPSGDWVAQKGDLCYAITFKSQSKKLEKLFSSDNPKRIRRIMIVGGGKIGTFLIKRLTLNHPQLDIKVIEKDRPTCHRLAIEFPNITVLNGDGLDDKLLRHEGVDVMDGFVAATGSDELNMLLAILGKSLQTGKSIAIVRNKTVANLANDLPIDAVINPNESLASVIMRHIRYPESAGTLSLIDGINSEILEIKVPENSPVIGHAIASLSVPKGTIFAMIMRNRKVIIPNGDTKIEHNDTILVFSTQKNMAKLAKQLGLHSV